MARDIDAPFAATVVTEVRDDLVSTDGHGSVQLVLHAHDTVKDEGYGAVERATP